MIDNFFSNLENKTGLKRVASRNYAHLRVKPNSLISVIIKKTEITTAFSIEGKSNSWPTDDYLNWVNESEILRATLTNSEKFVIQRGKKNKDKFSVSVTTQYKKGEDINESTVLDSVVEAFELIKSKLPSEFKINYDANQTQEILEEDEEFEDDSKLNIICPKPGQAPLYKIDDELFEDGMSFDDVIPVITSIYVNDGEDNYYISVKEGHLGDSCFNDFEAVEADNPGEYYLCFDVNINIKNSFPDEFVDAWMDTDAVQVIFEFKDNNGDIVKYFAEEIEGFEVEMDEL